MPPRRGARQGATTRRGRNARRNASERVEDEASQHGEHLGNQTVRQEEVAPPPGNQNPPNPMMADILAALAAQNLYNQSTRANNTSRAIEVAKEFRRMDPPKFDGLASDPLAADHWLSEIRDLFEVLDITEDHLRVRLIACQLTGEAKEWWKSVRAERKDVRRNTRATQGIEDPDVENMTWDEFEEKFGDQYFPRSYREQLREQFEKLEQGATTVTEYVIRFQSLSRFAPELVSSEERKCMRFAKGLRPGLRRLILSSRHDRFADVVEVARTLENDEEEVGGVKRSESRQSHPTISVTPGTYSG